MKKLSFALACAASVAVFATTIDSIGFEDYDAGFTGLSLQMDDGTAGAATESRWLYVGSSGDGSSVKAYGGENLAVPRGSNLSGTPGLNYLELSTEGGTLWRSINTLADATSMGAAQAVGADGLYVDTMVQFTPTEDGGTPEVARDPDDENTYVDKLAIWLNVDSSGAEPVTNLCALARSYDMVESDISNAAATFALEPADGSALSIDAGTWYRLTVKATKIVDDEGFAMIAGFRIFVDGRAMRAKTAPVGAHLAEAISGMLGANAALVANNELFPSLQPMGNGGDPLTLQGVGFKGSGAIDELVFTETNPLPASSDVNFTVTIPTGATATYAIGDAAATALPAGGVISGAAGAAYTVTITLADGTVAVKTGTIAADGSADYSTPDWSWYLAGAGTEEAPYVIPTMAEMIDFRKGSLSLSTEGLFFQQTADIDLGNMVWEGVSTDENRFKGTFDGQNHTIANFCVTNAPEYDYIGFFYSVQDCTIKNVKFTGATSMDDSVNAASGDAGSTSVVAGMIRGASLIENVTASGTIDGSYNVAGFATFVGGHPVFKDCTNHVNVTAHRAKTGAFVCYSSGSTEGCAFINCYNDGTITLNHDLTYDGTCAVGGFFGYHQGTSKVVFTNCVNAGAVTAIYSAGNANSSIWAGGFFGRPSAASSFEFVNCSNTAAVTATGQAGTGTSYAGGIMGGDCGLATALFENCACSGTLTATGLEGAPTKTGAFEAGDTAAKVVFGAGNGHTAGLEPFGVTAGVVGIELSKTEDNWTTYYAGLAGSGTTEAPFVVATALDLTKLRMGVDQGIYGAAGQVFQQTADIDMTGTESFPGIATYSEGTDGSNYFASTYDGAGHVISNLKLVAKKYTGLFNQVVGGTIKNLTVDTVTFDTASTTFGGAMIVANARRGSLLQGLVTRGTFGSAERPLSHNAAGVVCRITASTIDGCTNSAALVGKYSKVAGVAVITQEKDDGGTLVIQNCANSGSITQVNGSDTNGGVAGVLGYAATTAVTIQNCSNTGALASDLAGVHLGSIVGWVQSGTVTFDGVSSTPANAAVPLASAASKIRVVGADLAYIVSDSLTEFYPLAAMYNVIMAKVNQQTGAVPGSFYSFGNKVTATDMTLIPETLTAGTFTADADSTTTTADLITLLTPFLSKYNGNAGGAIPSYDLVQTADVTPAEWTVQAASAGYPTYIAADDAAKKAKYDTWKGLYGADTESAFEAAFLLNVDPTSAQALTNAKAAFAITAMAQDADGNWVVTVADTYVDGDAYANGTIEIRGCATLDGTYTAAAVVDKSARFFKAFLK